MKARRVRAGGCEQGSGVMNSDGGYCRLHTTACARHISGCRFPLPVATAAAAPHRRQGEQRAGRGQVYLFSAVTSVRKRSEVWSPWSPAFTRRTWRLPDHFLLVSETSQADNWPVCTMVPAQVVTTGCVSSFSNLRVSVSPVHVSPAVSVPPM